ncbi:MAG: ribosome recycling factor, partial [Clostridiales bacterium]|nr:ribosome recycling factor [Clostridiales bacterium]
EVKDLQEKLQKLTDKYGKEIDAVIDVKITEIMKV